MSNTKKDMKREYKLNPRPMGVYQIRNTVNGKVLVGAALDIPGILNRHKGELSAGSHRNRPLQAEWQEYGAEKFSFESLDELSPTGVAGHDYREELTFLEELWLEKVEPYGERGYNERKKGRDEKLKLIAQNRSGLSE